MENSIFVYENYITNKNLYTSKDTIKELIEMGNPGSCIYTIEKAFSDELCDNLIKYMITNKEKWKFRNIAYGNNIECNFLSIDQLKNDCNIAKKYDNEICNNINKILSSLRNKNKYFAGYYDGGYDLRQVFGKSHCHTDGIELIGKDKNYVRCLSLIIVLNDDYDGGVYNFPNHNVSFKAKKGQAVLFPPYWTHPHEVSSVSDNQFRYTINTWIFENIINS